MSPITNQNDVDILDDDTTEQDKGTEQDPEKIVVKKEERTQPDKKETPGPDDDEDDEKLISKEKRPDDKDEDEDEDEDEDKKKVKDEDDEDEDEEEPLKLAFDRPTIREIKGKYPEFFKEFPAVRDALFREAEYTQIFPTIEDARETFQDSEALSVLRDSALNGEPGPVLAAIEEADTKSLRSFAKNFLPSLYKKNQEAYSEAITPLLENIVRSAYNTGAKNNNEDLKNAALQLSNFIFDTDEVAAGKRTFARQEDTDSKRIREEREAELNGKYIKTLSEVSGEIQKNMRALIRKDFDPDDTLPPLMKRQAIDLISQKIAKQLEHDESHLSIMQGRWKHARSNGYTEQDKEKIIAAYVARAKNLVPSVRSKVWEGLTKTTKKTPKVNPPPKKELVGGPVSNNGVKSSGKVDYRKMSDLDILNS